MIIQTILFIDLDSRKKNSTRCIIFYKIVQIILLYYNFIRFTCIYSKFHQPIYRELYIGIPYR